VCKRIVKQDQDVTPGRASVRWFAIVLIVGRRVIKMEYRLMGNPTLQNHPCQVTTPGFIGGHGLAPKKQSAPVNQSHST